MKLQIELLVLACCALTGCHTNQMPVTREALVGDYVYKSEDPERRTKDHAWDRLTLQADGKYDLVQGGPTKPRSETVGTWTLWSEEANGPTVLLDHAGYP